MIKVTTVIICPNTGMPEDSGVMYINGATVECIVPCDGYCLMTLMNGQRYRVTLDILEDIIKW